ncbi:hypothetical protein [Streptomyces odonnellii]|uniref:hypothetical protein n=1 Tax=Streptomyces odonnellii TaxID=1417980 RepID=UPI00062659BF|nr:hypothetical protein [Streptomyces odonnellii]
MPRTAYRLAVASLLALAAAIVPAATASADEASQTVTVTTDAGWGSAPTTTPDAALTQDDAGWG